MDVKMPQKAQLSVADLPPTTVRHPSVKNVSLSFVSLGLYPLGNLVLPSSLFPAPHCAWVPPPSNLPSPA